MSDWKQRHKPCPHCGSSDAASMNGSGWWTCFACDERWPDGEAGKYRIEFEEESEGVIELTLGGVFKSYDRIPADVCERFGIRTDGNDIAFEYRDENGMICARKVRRNGSKEQQLTEGKWSDAKLFGQHLFTAGGRNVIITEGEKDAAAVYAMQGHFPVVSIRNGARSALRDCKREYKWLDSFEEIIVCFDMDEAGRTAAKEVANLFAGKSKVMNLRNYKDAHEMLVDAKADLFKKCFWEAEAYLPEGIVNGATLWDRLNKPSEQPLLMYPWEGLNRITHGIRARELVTLSAGSGVGKSQMMREIMYHCLTTTEDNIGAIFLEESVEKTAQSMMSLDLCKRLHLPQTESTEEERSAAFKRTLGTRRVFFYDLFGSTSVENIVSQVRYLSKAHDCKYIFLDHLSIIVSSQENGDERKAIDEVMTKLRTLVQDTGVCLFMISHLRRPEGKAHEEGAATSLSQLRGSASIAQLSDMVFGFERNGQAESDYDRNCTTIRVLKNRFSGETGKACVLYYDTDSGRLSEVHIEDEEVL